MDLKRFQNSKRAVTLPQGEIAYADIGSGPVALFIHGVFMNSLLWGSVIDGVKDSRRCIAIDLPAHGDTRVSSDAPLSLADHVDFIYAFLDELGIDKIDLVGNDTGGAIAQMFAVRYKHMLRTLTLTNCDVNENFPPDAFKDTIELARRGELAPVIAVIATNMDAARSEAGLGLGYQWPERISEDVVRAFLGRFADPEAARELERRIGSVAEVGLMAIEEELKAFDVPTLVVWGTGDHFFDVEWAYWLRDNVPGVTEVVEIPEGKLFFVDERADELIPHLARHWAAHTPSEV